MVKIPPTGDRTIVSLDYLSIIYNEIVQLRQVYTYARKEWEFKNTRF